MPVFEYFCSTCKKRFEEITSGDAPAAADCPRCSAPSRERVISRFAVGGRGDLRETTQHGCHDTSVGLDDTFSPSGHDHGHDHDHGIPHNHDHSHD